MMNYFSRILLAALLILPYMSEGQTPFSYDAAWKKVEAAFKAGKPKTALQEIETIYQQAKKDKQQAQQIKALVYKSTAIQQSEEDSYLKNITAFEQEMKTAAEPVKQILYSISADLYQQYFQQERWKLYDRTATNNSDPLKPETWSVADFNERISLYYQNSLSNPALLQKTKLDAYDPIINKGNMRHLRPTLYDLLAHKALEYWQNDESEITKPAYAFELNDAAALAPSKIFVRHKYTSQDSSSHMFKAIQLYQELIRFHLSDENPDALIDVDIARIAFAHSNGVMPGKVQLYKEALEHIYTQYGNNPHAMQAGYLLANWWKEKGDNYEPSTGTEEDKMAFAIALGYLDKIIKNFPKSEGGANAHQLKQEILKPSVGVVTEKANPIQKPFRALLSFKELATVYLRIVKLPVGVSDNENNYEEEDVYWKRVTGLNALKSWKQALPNQKDYREHQTEIKIDGLPNGRYLLLASATEDFKIGNYPLASTELYVSNLSFVQTDNHYFIVNRDNGQPIAAAKVQPWYTYYDYQQRKNVFSKGGLKSSDKNGYVHIQPNETTNRNQGNMRLEIFTNGDYLFMADALPRVYAGGQQKQQSAVQYELQASKYYFFTDRSIYRPGQTLYYKAIGLTTDASSGKPKLYKPEQVTLSLRNANFEEVAKYELTPNEYASVMGNLSLPLSGLTGNFQLMIKQGERAWLHSFRVEEYKRPQFYVEYPPLKGTYKLNNEIKITGMAKGYAGNTIDGASVAYRVKRATRFLYPWRFSFGRSIWPPQNRGDEMEITNGTTLTKPDGSFEISFTAIPDLSVNKELDPSFDFTIEAVVTDINGETRSEETTISVGYKSLLLTVTNGGGLMQSIDSTQKITVSSTNLNGVPENTDVQIKLMELVAPTRLIRERLWEMPDTYVMDQATFISHFPNDPYKNEADYRNWETGKTVERININTGKTAAWEIPKGKLKPGYYRIEATATDKDGNEVKAISYLAIFDAKNGVLAAPAYLMDYPIKTVVEPGEQASFLQGSTLSNGFMIEMINKKPAGGMLTDNTPAKPTFNFLQLNKGMQRYRFDATEADRGGYQVSRLIVQHNRVYTQNWMVQVPWSNKELNVSLETFRDKLLPGENETWKVKISGLKGEQLAAEMLASMYDASLDQFNPHNWERVNPWQNNYFYNRWGSGSNFAQSEMRQKYWYENIIGFEKVYDQFIGFARIENFYSRGLMDASPSRMMSEGIAVEKNSNVMMANVEDIELNEVVTIGYGTRKLESVVTRINDDKKNPLTDNSTIQIRKNFNETAFFFPDLKTDAEGNISFSFTMPEALTQWKLQLLAHTTDARFASATRNIVTQKELMVMPNAPRFFRQGDNMELSVKISNLSDKELTGQAELQLINANTMQPVDGWFKNVFPFQYFTVAAGQSTAVKFPMEIPYLYNDALMYRIVAKAGDISDGEEMALPVLTNRILVTESFPLNLRSTATKTFNWQRFKDLSADAAKNESLDHHSMTVEYTTNPAWYAIQSLPYLMEFPYDCAEQTWNRFYANALASKIANSAPRIKAIFDAWKNITPDALVSNLQKNQELKSALLEETPWVLDAKNETEQKKNIGLLFDLMRMQQEAENAMNKLQELQSSNGGFVWFKGGPDDRYMTQYIVTGIGHLRKLDAWPAQQQNKLKEMAAQAMPYLDARMKEDYDRLMKQKPDARSIGINSFAAQYLYMRSFFPELPIAANAQKAIAFYKLQAKQHWLKLAKYEQGMVALALHRDSDGTTPRAILASLTENSISHEEFGMYWKEFNNPGRYWWQAPIESHALLMEAYHEIESNDDRLDDLRTWLLKQKQTTNWKTTKATAEACYALLLRGTDWLSEERTVNIELGNVTVSSATNTTEAGTGYFKQVISKEKINASMGNIKVTTSVSGPKREQTLSSSTSWGAVYWQYFEDLDRITPAETGVSIKKELFVQRNTDRGPKLELLKEGAALAVGDRVKVRVEITNDRNMEYVHLKDMRASCFEPANVLSGYKYQGGMGYYEATRDASSNFFIGYLPRGTWVFEYELRTTHSGEFSNGITTLQCLYAPEFSSHSKGVRVTVE